MIGTVEFALLILLIIILAGPLLAERFGFPGLIGLIFLGMVAGPFMLGLLRTGGLVSDLGDVGLLYLMFLAGLSFNVRAFMENRSNALVYGLLGFFIPFLLSYYFALTVAETGVLAAALIGAMWASNTLVAYPEVLSAGLQNNRAVSAAVSAGVVADLLSLTVLGIVTSTAVIDIDSGIGVHATVENPSLPLWLGLPLIVVFTLWVLPKIADWFFVKIGHTRTQRFVFALAGMAAGSTIALLGGVEGLIGAFLAGLGLNSIIPARSSLMERLDFVGGAIFVPAFLVSIGFAIDPRAMFNLDTILLSLLFTGLVVFGKTLAAVITGAIFKLSMMEIGLMASLSTGQAASTLAIAQVGASLGLFGTNVVNASILTVVATAFITSYGTRFFIGRVDRPPVEVATLGENVLVDVRALGSDLDLSMAVAGAIARVDGGVVKPYLIPSKGQVAVARAQIALAVDALAATGHDGDGEIRIDSSFASGTLELEEEVDASLTIVTLRGPQAGTQFLFGNEVDLVGEGSSSPTIAVRLIRPWSRVLVFTGDLSNDWHSEDALLALEIARRVRSVVETDLVVATDAPSLVAEKFSKPSEAEVVEQPSRRRVAVGLIETNDLVIAPAHAVIAARSIGSWRSSGRLKDASLMIVGGPHRLSVGGSSIRRNLHGIVDDTEATREVASP
ncbi:MAG: cation:proton antiporter [Actinomycetia bacterium]|nr:cation:proton antiporter [Actinomycetes bacterium]